VQSAADGEAALAVAVTFRPDLVLLDLGLPKLDGYEVARRIRAAPWGKSVVLVALTGWGQEADRRRTRETGFDSHLVKPLDLDALTQFLTHLPPPSTALRGAPSPEPGAASKGGGAAGPGVPSAPSVLSGRG